MKSRSNRPFRLRKPLSLGAAGVVVALILGLGALALYTYNHGKLSKATPSASPSPMMTPVVKPTPSSGPGKDTNVHAGPGTATPTSTVPSPTSYPDRPIGGSLVVRQTISSHTVSRSSAVDSTCLTVQGARCYIQASNGTQTIQVSDTKTVDNEANGVDLPWSVSKIPSAGTWNIQAVASTSDGRQGISTAETIKVNP